MAAIARNRDDEATPESILLPIPLTSFVGRQREVAAVRDRVRRPEVRLLSVTGPGGVGKTRLALAAVGGLRDVFPDGISFCSLAAITDPALVPGAIAHAFGVREEQNRRLEASVRDYLRDRAVLLVIDNFEQVLPAAPFVVDLLVHCPALTVLVTSRVRLQVAGEQEFVTPPLALPDPMRPLAGLAESDAVTLFVERVRAFRPEFGLTKDDAAFVAEICLRLDGLPLAIELAAARIKYLSPAAVLARLENRFQFLSGGARDQPARQRTMRDTIAWSYNLLPAEDQLLFHRLAVCGGGFTIAAAEAIGQRQRAEVTNGPAGRATLDQLASLIDHSLVHPLGEAAGEPRFGMLETIRDYGVERLDASGEGEEVRSAHADFFLTLAEAAAPELTGAAQAVWLKRLAAEHANVRSALTWLAASGDAERLTRLACALWRYWQIRGPVSEGRVWLEQAAVQARDGGVTADLLARALYGAGWLAFEQGDLRCAAAQAETSLAIAKEHENKLGMAKALGLLSGIAHRGGDLPRSRRRMQESLALNREIDDEDGIAGSLNHLAILTMEAGDLDQAGAYFTDSRAHFAAHGNQLGAASALDNLSIVLSCQGDFPRAAECARQALAIFRSLDAIRGAAIALDHVGKCARALGDVTQSWVCHAESLPLRLEVGDRRGLAVWLEAVAALIAACGYAEPAVRILAAAEAVREAAGYPFHPHERIEYEQLESGLRRWLGAGSFATAWEKGKAMPVEQALTEAEVAAVAAVAAPIGAGPPLPLLPAPFGLTPRELEILRLLAQRRTDKEIADALCISPRTVGRHVSGIFNKLGVNSRHEAAAVASERGVT